MLLSSSLIKYLLGKIQGLSFFIRRLKKYSHDAHLLGMPTSLPSIPGEEHITKHAYTTLYRCISRGEYSTNFHTHNLS